MGIGFAIPSNMVARVVDNALHGAKIVRPWFGASGQEITADIAASLGMKRPVGILINQIYPNGPADRAGLKSGDVVLSLNGREVAEPRALMFRIATLGVGGQARLAILRGGREMTLTVPLERPPEIPSRDVTTVGGRNPLSGAVVANLSPALAEELLLDQMQTGVIVLGTKSGSRAGRLGIQPGDIVVRLNDRDIDTVATLRAQVERGRAPWSIVLRRNGKLLSATVEQ
jgi:serine protease Do